MSRKQYSLGNQLIVAAALALGTSSVALADDSSMNIWTGDSYAYFNGGQNFPLGKPVFDNAPSTWRPSPPQDALSFQQRHFPFALVVDNAPSTYRPGYPQDALTYQQQHFPFVNQTSGGVATNEAGFARTPK